MSIFAGWKILTNQNINEKLSETDSDDFLVSRSRSRAFRTDDCQGQRSGYIR
jgi:hypothetical protein